MKLGENPIISRIRTRDCEILSHLQAHSFTLLDIQCTNQINEVLKTQSKFHLLPRHQNYKENIQQRFFIEESLPNEIIYLLFLLKIRKKKF